VTIFFSSRKHKIFFVSSEVLFQLKIKIWNTKIDILRGTSGINIDLVDIDTALETLLRKANSIDLCRVSLIGMKAIHDHPDHSKSVD